MVTVNIVTPLPITGKLVTSQSVLKVREGAGKKKGKEKKAQRDHGFSIWLCQEKLNHL